MRTSAERRVRRLFVYLKTLFKPDSFLPLSPPPPSGRQCAKEQSPNRRTHDPIVPRVAIVPRRLCSLFSTLVGSGDGLKLFGLLAECWSVCTDRWGTPVGWRTDGQRTGGSLSKVRERCFICKSVISEVFKILIQKKCKCMCPIQVVLSTMCRRYSQRRVSGWTLQRVCLSLHPIATASSSVFRFCSLAYFPALLHA